VSAELSGKVAVITCGELQGYGHHIEDYVREDGRWRISCSRLERLRVDPLSATVPDLGG
jgi:hypothetical protein